MKNKINNFVYIIILHFIFLSCNLINDDSKGSGSMSVTMNDKYYDLADVTGTEYLGFYCGGYILGKRMELALGQNPQVGDTLLFTNQTGITYAVYSLYNHRYGIPGSGNIIVTKRSGSVITGTFSFNVMVDSSLIQFRDGNFNVEFKPSK